MRILVIDDEPLVRKSLARLLSRTHDVIAVESAEEAFEAIAAGFEVDVAFCDLVLGEGMSGREFCIELARCTSARAIIMSGSAPRPGDDFAHAWLMKPMTIADVDDALRRATDVAEAAE